MTKQIRTMGGVALAAILALSLVAGIGQGFASAKSDSGDNATLVARGPGGHQGGVEPRGATWE